MFPTWPAVLSAALVFVGGLIGAVLTYVLTRRKEHEADWRKLKLEQYREFVLALSGVEESRTNPVAQLRYADAINCMMLVAPAPVYRALQAYLDENSFSNANRSRAGHDRHLNSLVRAMRADTDPGGDPGGNTLQFGLRAPPPP